MQISIVTPSFRNSDWLKLCVVSVADQQGVTHEHIVQDSCSDDGTQEWLPHDPRVTAIVEKDTGMYDAVNRGFRRATGDIVAYLNCDEQYLPGALKKVCDFFDAHPEVDILLPDLVIIAADGSYICDRKSMVPLSWHIWSRFNVTTSSLFIRRRVFSELGLWFDPKWRDLGDFFWILAACRRSLRWAEMRFIASAFTETGDNMNLKANATRERAEKDTMRPALLGPLKPLILVHHRLRMMWRELFHRAPFSYEIYTPASPARRVRFDVPHPTGRWAGRI